ncbi:LemA family protein [Flavobacterium sp.]|jgi:LemA protein|uniref:LemA family protein n=1 Tax=Flavobacterium sp. TaxID=239 RepID=UPI002FD8A627
MRKWLLPVGIIVGLILIIGFYVVGIQNTAITKSQAVNRSWGDVQTSYQRRSDLIGNLVNTVKGAADFEKSTLEAVISARARATQTTIDPTNVTAEQLAQFNQAQSGVSSALSRLLVTVEAYPELKANQNFLKLQDELASTENTIQTARVRFNETIELYNNYILKFPNRMFLGEYKEKPFFDAEPGSEKAPEVKF